MRGLGDKKILVAGSATGIGAATARRLTEEGAQVLLGDINTEGVRSVAEELGMPWREFDLADAESVIRLVQSAREELGGLDGVANVAADLSPDTLGQDLDLMDMKIEIWQQTLNANLIGFALIIKEALPHLLEAGGGAIVNVSSGAYYAGEPTRPAYAASKAGINALTRHVATRWGEDNIRCNSVAPGAVMSETALATMSEEFIQQMKAVHQLPRLGRPEDLAASIAYLLSEDGEWVTGQVWNVNGGNGYRD